MDLSPLAAKLLFMLMAVLPTDVEIQLLEKTESLCAQNTAQATMTCVEFDADGNKTVEQFVLPIDVMKKYDFTIPGL